MTKKAIQPNISDQLIAELVSQIDPKEILSKDGLFAQLKKKIVEKVMQRWYQKIGQLYKDKF